MRVREVLDRLSVERWAPASVLALPTYSRRTFVSDLIAGLTVGLVALPLAMAFAISSGMPPQAGIYCAVVAGFLISALGGSNVQIGGPTGAFVVIVFGIVAQHGLDGLFMCTIMAGVMLVVMGLTGIGTAVQFIPRPVVVGFTNGIAVLIASTQIKDFFGLTVSRTCRASSWAGSRRSIEHARHRLVADHGLLAAGVVLLIVIWNRLVPRVPGSIVALLVGTVVVAARRTAGRDHRHRGSAASPAACPPSPCRSSART